VDHRCFEQIFPIDYLVRWGFGSVIVSVLAGAEEGGQGPQGGLGDLGEDGGLLTGLVPQDSQVERVEQAGFAGGVQAGQDVPGVRPRAMAAVHRRSQGRDVRPELRGGPAARQLQGSVPERVPHDSLAERTGVRGRQLTSVGGYLQARTR
jgi:hypothetical protein